MFWDIEGYGRMYQLEQKCILKIGQLKTLYINDVSDHPVCEDIIRFLINTVPPGYYEHFKSREDDRKFYYVFGVGADVNMATTKIVDERTFPVAYYSLYGPRKGQPASRQLVGKDSFLSPIQRENYIGRRFRKLSDEECERYADQLRLP